MIFNVSLEGVIYMYMLIDIGLLNKGKRLNFLSSKKGENKKSDS